MSSDDDPGRAGRTDGVGRHTVADGDRPGATNGGGAGRSTAPRRWGAAGGSSSDTTSAEDRDGDDAGAFGDEVVRYLEADGRPLADADLPAVDDETLLEIYQGLVLARRLDERALSLQRQGRIATWAPMAGQEGSQVASAVAMSEADWLYPTYRDNAAKVVRGTEPAAILARLRGHDHLEGFDVGERVFPETIPIASHLPHAVGAAAGSRYRGREEAHVVHFGDGATSEGDFHEGLNFAGVLDVPVVFFCHNNGWAISTPTSRQTASPTLAEKAHAYGFDGVRVDGMDPLAVYDVTRRALERVRTGVEDGPRPLLVEAIEYRLGAHTTADDPDVYRDGVPDEWAARDPVPRFETFLRERGLLDDEGVETVAADVEETVADAVDRVEALDPDPDDLFEHVYADLPAHLADQREELERYLERDGGPAGRDD